jgi:acetyltransferase
MTNTPDLSPLLAPGSVAIIGATHNQRRFGGRPIQYLDYYGFKGGVYPVNPKYDEVGGVKCYPHISDLPETPDLAIVAVPSTLTIDAVRDCQAAGVPALILYTSGFAEMGEDGAKMQAEIRAMALDKGTIICGPNCQGAANFHIGFNSYVTSALGDVPVRPGAVGFASQSGMFGGMFAKACMDRDLGLGYIVSTGNEVVLDFSDVLAYMLADPNIRVVAGYLEGLRDADKLRNAARIAREQDKPIVILKVGRNEASATAAASHTASMAGSYDAYRAAFDEWGIIEANSIAELFDITEAFARTKVTRGGKRVGMLTNSGGVGVFLADQVPEVGLVHAEFSEHTVKALAKDMFAFGSPRNPVDLATQFTSQPEVVGKYLRHILADDAVDGVISFFGVQRRNPAVACEQLEYAAASSDKPFVVCWSQGAPEAIDRLRASGIPVYDDSNRALIVLRAMLRQGDLATTPTPEKPAKPAAEAKAAAKLLREHRGAVLDEEASKAVLAAAGIPVTRSETAKTAKDAAAAADRIGYPVALKIVSPDIPHKTEAGGVVLGVKMAEEVRAAFERITDSAKAYAPDAQIEGVGVHEMVTDSVEAIVGVTRDPTFGPLVLVGIGGIAVEVYRDRALRLPPVSESGADAMVKALRGYPLLDGARGRPKADVAALCETIRRVSDFALACDDLGELDINPLMVRADGQGVVAADALIRVMSQDHRPESTG